VVPLVNDAATPTLAFGDGDTGFYEQVDDTLWLSIAGAAKWKFLPTVITGVATNSSALLNVVATATTPGLLPRSGDTDTGIGLNALDELSLIAGAVEMLRLDEDTTESAIFYPGGTGDIVDPAGDLSEPGTVSTTDATQTTIEALAVASDSSVGFACTIAARRTDADGESAYYKLEGMVDNNAGTSALVGTVTKTIFAEDTAAWDVTATADDTADTIDVDVIGEAGKNITWVSRCETTEAAG